MSDVKRYDWHSRGMGVRKCGPWVDGKDFDRLADELSDRDRLIGLLEAEKAALTAELAAARAEVAAMLRTHEAAKAASFDDPFDADKFDTLCQECNRVFGNPSSAGKELLAELAAAKAECERLKRFATLGEMLFTMLEAVDDFEASDRDQTLADSFISQWLSMKAARDEALADLDKANRTIKSMSERCDQDRKTIANLVSQHARRDELECEQQAKFHEAIRLLRDWTNYVEAESLDTYAETIPFLATIDAGEAAIKAGKEPGK